MYSLALNDQNLKFRPVILSMCSARYNKPFATPIFRLPSEVLLNVLAFINARDPVSFRSRLHQVYTAPQIVILRWVCRIFRHLSCAL